MIYEEWVTKQQISGRDEAAIRGHFDQTKFRQTFLGRQMCNWAWDSEKKCIAKVKKQPLSIWTLKK